MQSIVETFVRAPSSGSPSQGRPSISALNSTESTELDDGISTQATSSIEASANKSPVNTSASEYSCVYFSKIVH